MNSRSAQLVHTMLDLLRPLLWTFVTGFAVLGATFYGGPAVYAWQKTLPPARHGRADDDLVAKEAATGIADIEAFLAQRSPAPRPFEARASEDRRRNGSPPA